MLFENVLDRVFGSEELIDADGTTVLTGKEVTAMCEDDLTTLLDRNLLVLHQSLLVRWLVILEDVHHLDSVSEANDYLESSWMERHT